MTQINFPKVFSCSIFSSMFHACAFFIFIAICAFAISIYLFVYIYTILNIFTYFNKYIILNIYRVQKTRSHPDRLAQQKRKKKRQKGLINNRGISLACIYECKISDKIRHLFHFIFLHLSFRDSRKAMLCPWGNLLIFQQSHK